MIVIEEGLVIKFYADEDHYNSDNYDEIQYIDVEEGDLLQTCTWVKDTGHPSIKLCPYTQLIVLSDVDMYVSCFSFYSWREAVYSGKGTNWLPNYTIHKEYLIKSNYWKSLQI